MSRLTPSIARAKITVRSPSRIGAGQHQRTAVTLVTPLMQIASRRRREPFHRGSESVTAMHVTDVTGVARGVSGLCVMCISSEA